MKRKIGEVFEYALESGEVVVLKAEKETNRCDGCFFKKSRICEDDDVSANIIGDCEENNVVFVQTEKHNSPEADKKKQQKAKNILLDLAQESDTFDSQQEIWMYLSASEENKVVDNAGGIIGFKNGRLIEFNDGKITNLSLRNFQDWKKYTPPKTIMVNGVEIEAPLKSLKGVNMVYVPDFVNEEKYCEYVAGSNSAQKALENNTAFATPEGAIACHDALLKGIIISH